MRTLSGECLHFLLRRGDDLRTLRVDLVASTEEAVAKWDWTTRSSPIFPFVEFEYPDWPNEDDVYVLFVGPLDPASWDIDVPCYASLGTYNIVAVCTPGKGHLYDSRAWVRFGMPFGNTEVLRDSHTEKWWKLFKTMGATPDLAQLEKLADLRDDWLEQVLAAAPAEWSTPMDRPAVLAYWLRRRERIDFARLWL